MHLNFSKKLNRVLIIFFCIALFSTTTTASTISTQKIVCQDKTQCELYALTDQGQKLIESGTKSILDGYNFEWLQGSTSLGSFNIGCGTACEYSYIVNYKTGEVSNKVYLIYATNQKKQVMVLPDPDDPDLKTLLVRPFFCKKGIKIKRDFNPDNANAINDIYFDQNGNLYLDYSTTCKDQEIKETININYSKIEKICRS